nr:hypothetical protein [uncultured Alistipes sp.]
MTKNSTRTLLEWVVAVLAVTSLLIWLVTDWHLAGIIAQALSAVAACCVLFFGRPADKQTGANASRRNDRQGGRSDGRNARNRNARSGRNASAGSASAARRGEEPARQQPSVRNRAEAKPAQQRTETASRGETPARQAAAKEGDAPSSSRRRRRNRGHGGATASEQPQGETLRNAASAQPAAERNSGRRKPSDEAAAEKAAPAANVQTAESDTDKSTVRSERPVKARPTEEAQRSERAAKAEDPLRKEPAADAAAGEGAPASEASAEGVAAGDGLQERPAGGRARSRHRRRAPRPGGDAAAETAEAVAGTGETVRSDEGSAERNSNETNKPTE